MVLARAIGETPALLGFKARDLSPVPDDFRDDAAMDRWIRAGANTIFHPVGTARMGADAGSVVDPELRVRGGAVCGWPMHRSCRASSAATPLLPA